MLTDAAEDMRGYGAGFEDENFMTGRDEKGITPRFYTEVVRNAAGSEKAGYDVFDEVEFIEITRSGDKLNTWVGRVGTEHKQRFPNAYKRFQAGLALATHGTPLEEWPLISKSVVYQWKAIGITTVEDLADLDDGALPNLGIDGRGWRDKAANWIKARTDGAQVSKITAALAKLEAESARKDQTIADLAAKLDALLSENPEYQARKTLSVKRPQPVE